MHMTHLLPEVCGHWPPASHSFTQAIRLDLKSHPLCPILVRRGGCVVTSLCTPSHPTTQASSLDPSGAPPSEHACPPRADPLRQHAQLEPLTHLPSALLLAPWPPTLTRGTGYHLYL